MKDVITKLLNLCVSRNASQTTTERQTIEHWSKREPFYSSNRAFGHIELINPIETPTGPCIAVRGWIFDSQSRLSDLQISCPQGAPGTTIAQLVREDVAKSMPCFQEARTSGFVSLLPLVDTEEILELRASYRVGYTSINVPFEKTPCILGLTTPGKSIQKSAIDLSKHSNFEALILLPGWEPTTAAIEPVITGRCRDSEHVVVFTDLSQSNLDNLCNTEKWRQRSVGALSEIAGTLLTHVKTLRSIILIGPPTSEVVCGHILPVLMRTHSSLLPPPPVQWIVPPAYDKLSPNTLPQELRGKLIEWTLSKHALESL